jgi:hypothetical protein
VDFPPWGVPTRHPVAAGDGLCGYHLNEAAKDRVTVSTRRWRNRLRAGFSYPRISAIGRKQTMTLALQFHNQRTQVLIPIGKLYFHTRNSFLIDIDNI